MMKLCSMCGLLLFSGCRGGAEARHDLLAPLRAAAQSSAQRARDQPVQDQPHVNLEDGLTLEEALTLASAQNPRLEVARREMQLALAQRTTAGQWPFNPEISAGLDRALPLGGSVDSTPVVGLSQKFEIGGQRGHRVSIAETNIERARSAIVDAERLVRTDVATVFFENLMLDERTKLAAENVAIAKKLLEAATARFEAKQIPEVGLNLVRLQYQRTRNERARVTARRRAARMRLKALLGEPGETDLILEGGVEAEPRDISRAKALQTAWNHRPDLKALQRRMEMSEEQIHLEEARIWPEIDVGVSYGRDTQFIDSLSDRDNFVGITFSLPIPVLNRREGEIAQARAVLRILSASLYDLKRRIERDVDLTLNRLALARETLQLYQMELNRLSRQNLEEFEKAYRAGEVGTLEVLRAQDDYNRVTAGYQEALFEYSAAQVGLESVLGGSLPEEK